jgi:hypothetical protein
MYTVAFNFNNRGATAAGTYGIYWRRNSSVIFTGSISGTTLTVSSVEMQYPGTLTNGAYIYGSGVSNGTYIAYQIFGASGTQVGSTTATGTSGTNTITVASTTNMIQGQLISGLGATLSGVDPATYIINISGTTVTLSKPLTGNLSSTTIYFYAAGGRGSYLVNNSQTVSSTTMSTGGTVFLATASGTTLTVTAMVSGTISPINNSSYLLYGSGIGSGAYITALGTGTGGTGTYTLNQTVATISVATPFTIIRYDTLLSPLTASFNTSPVWTNTTNYIAPPTNPTAPAGYLLPTSSLLQAVANPGNTNWATTTATTPINTFQGTGSISGNTLTITAVTSGALAVGSYVTGTNFLPNTYIIGAGTGTGGAGTYTLNNSQTAASTTVYGQPVIGTAPAPSASSFYSNDTIFNNIYHTLSYPFASPQYPQFNTGTVGGGTGTMRAQVPTAGYENESGRFCIQWTAGANLTSALGIDSFYYKTENGIVFYDFEPSAAGWLTSVINSATLTNLNFQLVGYVGSATAGNAQPVGTTATAGLWVRSNTNSPLTNTGPVSYIGSTATGYTGSVTTNTSGSYFITLTAVPAGSGFDKGNTLSGITNQGAGAQVVNSFSTITTASMTFNTWVSTISYTATADNLSNILRLNSAVTYLCQGQTVTGTGIPANTIITTVFPAANIVIINNYTTSALSGSAVVIGANAIYCTGLTGTGSIGQSITGTNIPSNSYVQQFYGVGTAQQNYVLVLNQNIISTPSGTMTLIGPANSLCVTVPSTGTISATANNATIGPALTNSYYLYTNYNTNSAGMTLYSPEIILYGPPYEYNKDADGVFYLGSINTGTTTSVNITLNMATWVIDTKGFFIYGGFLPSGLTLSTSGVISGTVSTAGLAQGTTRYQFSVLAFYTYGNGLQGSNISVFNYDVNVPVTDVIIPYDQYNIVQADLVTTTTTTARYARSTPVSYTAGMETVGAHGIPNATVSPSNTDPKRTSVIVIG